MSDRTPRPDDRPSLRSPLSRPATQRGVAFALAGLFVIVAGLFWLFSGGDADHGDLVEAPAEGKAPALMAAEGVDETASSGTEGEQDAVLDALGADTPGDGEPGN